MDTKGSEPLGYSALAEISLSVRDVLRVGADLHRFTLCGLVAVVDDDGGPPWGQIPCGTSDGGERDRFGTFAEWEGRHGPGLTELLASAAMCDDEHGSDRATTMWGRRTDECAKLLA